MRISEPTNDNASPEHRIRELTKELSDAREQQAATAEILRVISSSPRDPRVFAEIATSAARRCDTYDAVIHRTVRCSASLPNMGRFPGGSAQTCGALPGRAALEHRTIHIADLQ